MNSKLVELKTNDFPIYEGTIITKNKDGTYKVVNQFDNFAGGKHATVTYNRVCLKIDYSLSLYEHMLPINPLPKFSDIEVLTGDDKGTLFNLIIEE